MNWAKRQLLLKKRDSGGSTDSVYSTEVVGRRKSEQALITRGNSRWGWLVTGLNIQCCVNMQLKSLRFKREAERKETSEKMTFDLENKKWRIGGVLDAEEEVAAGGRLSCCCRLHLSPHRQLWSCWTSSTVLLAFQSQSELILKTLSCS